MARMRFASRPRPRPIVGVVNPNDRRPEHLGDVPPAAPKPEQSGWSLSSYPYPEPAFTDDEEGDADG